MLGLTKIQIWILILLRRRYSREDTALSVFTCVCVVFLKTMKHKVYPKILKYVIL